jgi:hypothetical protein
LFTAILLTYLHVFYANQLQVIVWLILGLLGLFAICVTFFGGWYLAEKMRMLRAARIDLEKQAHVLQLHNGNQTWIRDTDHNAVWHSLHLEQRVYSNGKYSEPNQTEREAWQTFNAKPAKVIESESQPLLPTPQLSFDEVINNAQRTLIIGASNSGKTTVLQHVLRLKQHTDIFVIDPHSYPDKWPFGKVSGVGRDYAAIDETLAGLVGLMTKRYQEIAKGNLNHSPVTVVIDEWRAITLNLDSAGNHIKTLLTESRKANFSIFVASHSDRARPLGLQGEYDLKQGFTVIRLFYDNYRRLATVDLGEGQRPISLPGPFTSAQQSFSTELVELPKPVPNALEQRVIDLYEGGMKITPIAEEVFGSKGGNQVGEVRNIIDKWCKV